jgi:hypothetical protein
MVGEPFEFGHQSAQPVSTRRRFEIKRGFDRPRKSNGISHSAVARHALGQAGCLLEFGTGHETLDAAMDIAQPLLEPDDGLAAGGEAEMARLDDSGMYRSDRDLVEAFAIGWQEWIGIS